MKVFRVHSLTGAIICSLLVMGVIGVLVVLPIACINLSWNSLSAQLSFMPPIGPLQAALLYTAAVLALYLSGIIIIEVKTDSPE